MCDFVSAERRKETLESGIAALQCWCFFFLSNCKAVFLSVFFPRGHNWKRSFFIKVSFEKRLGNQIENICYTAVWWEKKPCAKIVPCLKRKLYFTRQSSTARLFFAIVKLWFFIIRSSKQVKIHSTPNPPALHPTKSLHLCYLFILAIICLLSLISSISWEAIKQNGSHGWWWFCGDRPHRWRNKAIFVFYLIVFSSLH